MKALLTILFVLTAGHFTFTQLQQAAQMAPDSVEISVHAGSDNKEMQQLMTRVLHIEKLHFESHSLRLTGKRFHLTFQEYKNGIADSEKELVGNGERLTKYDQQGNFVMDVFARQTSENSLENQFLFTNGATKKTFTALPGKGADYSLSERIWPYKVVRNAASVPDQQPTSKRNFAIGRKVPFLVYTLPYEKDGWLLYCDLIQSKVPVNEWYSKFKIPHFIVYNLLIE
ncbi:hypothetical protein [uncultured Hymenobacter sp.]|uniref:hypothetical protein n=1 Tax=uncultured Hymenobacter sp. TaxID=170016 RepID=UPI0035C9FB1A